MALFEFPDLLVYCSLLLLLVTRELFVLFLDFGFLDVVTFDLTYLLCLLGLVVRALLDWFVY